MERRLTTVVAADIVGFTRLVELDEERTLSAQRAHRKEFLDPLVANLGGRLANTAGDSLLIEFPSAVQAVRFAVDAQAGMRERNSDTPEDQRISYRMGINVGDVVADGQDLLGDGVNVAARLEALAPSGGIILSSTVRDQVQDKLDIALTDLGDIQVKNRTRPVRAFQVADGGAPAPSPKFPRPAALGLAALVVILGAAIWWWLDRPDVEPVLPEQMAFALPDEPSIAVMAFAYIGPGQVENGYLADGLSENITTNLAKLPDILVIGESTPSGRTNEATTGRDIAGQYGVRYVLDGSVQKSGEELRISAKLLDAITGKHLWSETFNRKTGDFFDIQDEITLAVLEQVYAGTLDGDRLTLRETNSLKAFSENAKGRTHHNRFTAEDNETARVHYASALAQDPNYVDALVNMAFTHIMDVRLAFSENPAQSLTLAEEYLAAALEIDPSRPATLSNLAVLRVVQKRGEDALAFARQALDEGIGDVRV
ncbi:MAG: adenylate/guanylate cyclase domain-containing protein, partial [Pseudomonadota bacterium]